MGVRGIRGTVRRRTHNVILWFRGRLSRVGGGTRGGKSGERRAGSQAQGIVGRENARGGLWVMARATRQRFGETLDPRGGCRPAGVLRGACAGQSSVGVGEIGHPHRPAQPRTKPDEPFDERHLSPSTPQNVKARLGQFHNTGTAHFFPSTTMQYTSSLTGRGKG